MAKVNAETGELLARELTPIEERYQAEWREDMRKARERLHQSYRPTDYTKSDTPAEIRRFNQGLDPEKRCEHCFMVMPKAGRCDCRD